MTSSRRARTRVGLAASGRASRSILAAALFLLASGLCTTAAAEVTVHDPDLSAAGYNLLTSHDPPGAVLIDMDGAILHRWTCRLADAFPEADVPDGPGFSDRWTVARLLPDGGILGIIGGVGLVRLDWTSRVVWAHEGGEHSDLEVTGDGTIYVLSREWTKVSWVNQRSPVLADFVLVLSADGELLNRISLLGAVASSNFSNVIRTAHMNRSNHVLRANSLQVLDGSIADRIPSFTAGNVLVSLPGLDTIAILDVESKNLLWAQFGMWRDQLDSNLLAEGRVLLLEHSGGEPRVIEFDPVTMELKWTYQRDTEGAVDDLYGGAVQRLTNGNTLISEAGRGRAFEVTPGGDVVWEYTSPADESGAGTPVPFELTRIESDFPMN